jgi:hypothetical protein
MVRSGKEMASQPPAKFTAGGRQQPAQMSIAFLVGDHLKNDCMDPEAIKDCFDMTFTPGTLSPAHPAPWTLLYDLIEMPRMEHKVSPLQTDLSRYSHGHFSLPPRRVESTNDISSLSSVHASNGETESCGYDSSSPSSMLFTGFPIPSSSHGHPGSHCHRRCHNRPIRTCKLAGAPAREPRLARPSYNEEQKFFIMHHRIVKKLSWPEVENEFARYFKLRSKDGLTSVYYRIRSSWGMGQILKNQSRSEDDRGVIEGKADHFSRAFLVNIGYFD